MVDNMLQNFLQGVGITILVFLAIGGPLAICWQLGKLAKAFHDEHGCIAMFVAWCFVLIVAIGFVCMMILIGSAI